MAGAGMLWRVGENDDVWIKRERVVAVEESGRW